MNVELNAAATVARESGERKMQPGKVQMVGIQPYEGEDTEVIVAIGRDGFFLPWWFPWGPGGGSAMDKLLTMRDSHLIDGEVFVTLEQVEETIGTQLPNIRSAMERQRLQFIEEGAL